jgi:hypothetical protein
MSKHVSVNTTVCSEYQKLLEESRSALEIWNQHREVALNSCVIKKEAGDELQSLQAKFAKAYTVLQNHAHNCALCQLVARIEGRDSENDLADTVPDNTLYV